ncbi:MAG: SoxR reducing system RseC family protein, partial [Fervidobacterium pennivorans]
MREVMKVTNVDEKFVYLSLAVLQATCSSCAIAGSCSVKDTGKELRIMKKSIKKELLPLTVGDTVIVDMKYNTALLSLIVYGIPLAGFIIGVLLGYLLNFQDIVSFLLGLILTGVGALITRFFDKKYKIEVIDVKHLNQFMNQFNLTYNSESLTTSENSNDSDNNDNNG